jgi:hypothetical protein
MESSRETVLNSCFNLMRRLSPNDISKNVAGLANLIKDEGLKYEVVQKIDQPLGKFSLSFRGFPDNNHS